MVAADENLKARLEKLFAGDADRRAVLEAAKPVLSLQGVAERGAQIFAKRCSTCHRQNGVGHEVGPNLASLTSREPALLLHAILDPGAAVEAKYLNFVAVTSAGRSVAGMLTTETDGADISGSGGQDRDPVEIGSGRAAKYREVTDAGRSGERTESPGSGGCAGICSWAGKIAIGDRVRESEKSLRFFLTLGYRC